MRPTAARTAALVVAAVVAAAAHPQTEESEPDLLLAAVADPAARQLLSHALSNTEQSSPPRPAGQAHVPETHAATDEQLLGHCGTMASICTSSRRVCGKSRPVPASQSELRAMARMR